MRERTQIGYLIDDRVDNTNEYSSKFHRVLLHGAEISIEISIRMDRSNNHKYGAMLYFDLVRVKIHKYPQLVKE